MDLQDRIRMLLERDGMSQADLARATGVTATAVSRYMNGSRRPKTPFLRKVAGLFGVSMYWLAFGDEEKNEGFGAVKNIVARNAGSLTYEQKMELMRIISEASIKLESQK